MKALLLILFFCVPLTVASAEEVFSKEMISKAGIAVVMGREPAIMLVEDFRDGVYYISYLRPDDGKKWDFKAKIDGSRIVWGANPGRWREHPLDSKVTFSVKGKRLTISDNHTDGSVTTKSFNPEDF